MRVIIDTVREWQDNHVYYLNQAIAKAGSRLQLSLILKTRYQTISAWLRGSIPNLDHIIQIQEYLLSEEE